MSSINVHAVDANGNDFPSKAALKRAIAADPRSVTLITTSAFDGAGLSWQASTLLARDPSNTAVGPNPHTNRKWYATIGRNHKGIVTVS